MARPIRVLLVEDNPADVELMKETLSAKKFHLDLEIALDGERAWRALTDRGGLPPIDLVMLDLNLPRVSGTELLDRMRANDQLRKTPVVVLTSSGDERDILKSYGLGANCYLQKPVGFHDLQQLVEAMSEFWFTVVRLPTVSSLAT